MMMSLLKLGKTKKTMKEFFDFFKGNFFIKALLFLYTLLTSWFTNGQTKEIQIYKAPDINIHNEIVKMDSIYFNAYNTCNLKKQEELLSDDIEFLHDKGGVSTSKEEILSDIEKKICGKVTRTLIKGSIEVYPIHDYGAVQIGYHKFYNNQEPTLKSIPAKFIIIWKKENNNWKMKRIVSLH